MSVTALTLNVLPDRLAVCRLDAQAPVPAWIEGGCLSAVVRTVDELSVVCAEQQVPSDVASERGWRALRVQGPLDFALVGVLARLLTPLAAAGVSVFTISTYDTDYVLAKEASLPMALEALRAAGHEIMFEGR